MLQQSGPVETMVLGTSVTARQTAPVERGWSFSSWQRGSNGASCQLWPPGTPVLSEFVCWCQPAQFSARTPLRCDPRTTFATWRCLSSPSKSTSYSSPIEKSCIFVWIATQQPHS